MIRRIALIISVVPIQTTMLEHVSLGGVRPDLCLVAACLIGFTAGEVEGMLIGLALGFVEDLFSAGDSWLNTISKGLFGLLSGLTARHLASPTPLAFTWTLVSLSLLSGLLFAVWSLGMGTLSDSLVSVRSVIIPQAAFDAAVGAVAYWWVTSRGRRKPLLREGFVPFDR